MYTNSDLWTVIRSHYFRILALIVTIFNQIIGSCALSKNTYHSIFGLRDENAE